MTGARQDAWQRLKDRVDEAGSPSAHPGIAGSAGRPAGGHSRSPGRPTTGRPRANHPLRNRDAGDRLRRHRRLRQVGHDHVPFVGRSEDVFLWTAVNRGTYTVTFQDLPWC